MIVLTTWFLLTLPPCTITGTSGPDLLSDRLEGGLGRDRAWADRLDRTTGIEQFG